MKPRLFIGSSTEGLPVAMALQTHLADVAQVEVWNQGSFALSGTVIEQLVTAAATFDYSVFIIRADDVVRVRLRDESITRANVLFELGLFAGRKGLRRTFILYDVHMSPTVLSDLAGLVTASFDSSNPSGLLAALGPAAFKIIQEMERKADETWYTEWHFGSTPLIERLDLFVAKDNILTGTRVLEDRKGPKRFDVLGFRGGGFDWLEYHLRDGKGGGTIMLRNMGTGNATGLIAAAHCDTGNMRAYRNRWVQNGTSGDYQPEWLVELANFNP